MISSDILPVLQQFGADAVAIQRLEHYAKMIRQWNKAINLIAPSTLSNLWERHILDSAQLWPVIIESGQPSRIIDLGSGGGLPGLVLAMMGAEHVTMIESDARKCVFLREVSRETGLANVTVINQRIEEASKIKAPIITARALAALPQLIIWASPLLDDGGQMIFLKGEDVSRETEGLTDDQRANLRLIPSVTQNNAFIVCL